MKNKIISNEKKAEMRASYKQELENLLFRYNVSDAEIEDILDNPYKHLENVDSNEDQQYVSLLIDLVENYKQQELPQGYRWFG
ncbi:hypothetical protein [Glaesserella sp. 15-184]|uniref:hypothetical protein n=1 Tax=Glaesserella sp. 15-184 TaxID=2030797 RepID=UPI000D25B14E|nr:hypothetical protein [Glaesserella sp. 15-184]AUI67214.1 hypothetical protein CJD39_11430 [Glaesserella sp. 15-184]